MVPQGDHPLHVMAAMCPPVASGPGQVARWWSAVTEESHEDRWIGCASGARASPAAGVYSVADRVPGCEDSGGAADGGRQMASEQLKTVLELVGSADLGTLTLQ